MLEALGVQAKRTAGAREIPEKDECSSLGSGSQFESVWQQRELILSKNVEHTVPSRRGIKVDKITHCILIPMLSMIAGSPHKLMPLADLPLVQQVDVPRMQFALRQFTRISKRIVVISFDLP